MKSSNMKIIYAILLLMNFLGAIKGKNESQSYNANSEKTLANSGKRKLEVENYMIVKYGENVTYSKFDHSYRKKIDSIEYENGIYTSKEELKIKANTEIKIYITRSATSFQSFFHDLYDTNAKKIVSVDLSNLNSSLITTLKSMFYGCSSIQNINFFNFNTSKVKDMSYMFFECEQLQSLDLSSFDTSSITTMGYMFQNCTYLQLLNLSNFNTPKLKKLQNMFKGCNQLQALNLSNFNTSSVTAMESMF